MHRPVSKRVGLFNHSQRKWNLNETIGLAKRLYQKTIGDFLMQSQLAIDFAGQSEHFITIGSAKYLFGQRKIP